MKTLLIVLLLAVPAFAQDTVREETVCQESTTLNNVPVRESVLLASRYTVKECINDCGVEHGICIGECQGSSRCFARCAEAQGRCIARCKHR